MYTPYDLYLVFFYLDTVSRYLFYASIFLLFVFIVPTVYLAYGHEGIYEFQAH